MPLLTLLGLVLSLIKVGMEVAAYLQAHPDTTEKIREAAGRVVFTLGQAHAEMEEVRQAHVESP